MSYKREIILNAFQELIFDKFKTNIDSITELKADASDRKIYRIFSGNKSYIGINNDNPDENAAFIGFGKTFLELGLNVPEIYNVSEDNLFYIERDLGDMTLHKYSLDADKEKSDKLYKTALSDLIKFQINTKDKIDYTICYQTQIFDNEVLRSDVKKFSYYFVDSFAKEKINEKEIDEIIEILSKKIINTDCNYFLYRDFQPRNIMLFDDKLFYIDFQSGRKGPLQYDPASFLYSGSIYITDAERLSLLEHYERELKYFINYDAEEFRYYFYYFAFARLLQAIGSYAYIYKKRNDVKMKDKILTAIQKMKGLYEFIHEENIKKFIMKLTEIKIDITHI